MQPDRMDEAPAPGPELPIIRLKASESAACIILSQRLRGYRTHWDNQHRKTLPCFLPHDECEGHRKNLPQRWKGFLHVLRERRDTNGGRKHQEGFLELTPAAWMDLRIALGHAQDLRGLMFTVTRLNGDRAHLKVAVFPDCGTDVSKLPAEKSPYATLMRLWGFLHFPPEEGQAAPL